MRRRRPKRNRATSSALPWWFWPAFASAGVGLVVAFVLRPRSASAAALPAPKGRALTPELRAEYASLWASAVIRPERMAQVDRVVDVLASNRARYEAMARASGVPWYVIAVIHSLEGGGQSGDFSRHLHNGDSLAGRTVTTPVGMPRAPPAAGEGHSYTWEESASDALARWRGMTDWSLPSTLWELERYNGLGYRQHHPEVLTPYLWSFTNHYTRGKVTSGGGFDPNLVSAQAGAAALLRRMVDRGII